MPLPFPFEFRDFKVCAVEQELHAAEPFGRAEFHDRIGGRIRVRNPFRAEGFEFDGILDMCLAAAGSFDFGDHRIAGVARWCDLAEFGAVGGKLLYFWPGHWSHAFGLCRFQVPAFPVEDELDLSATEFTAFVESIPERGAAGFAPRDLGGGFRFGLPEELLALAGFKNLRAGFVFRILARLAE